MRERLRRQALRRLFSSPHARGAEHLAAAWRQTTCAETSEFEKGAVAEQTRRTLENILAILQAAGAGMGDVVKCSVSLADIRDFAEMNGVYAEYFGDSKPARTTVQATLPAHGLKVEIDCVAYKPAGE